MSAVVSTGNLTPMASRQSAAKKPPAKKAAAPTKAPAKKAPAKKAAARKAPAKKARRRRRPLRSRRPIPPGACTDSYAPSGSVLAHAVGAVFRGIGQGAKDLDPAHRKDGVALLLLGLALIVAAGTWSNLRGPVGDLVEMLVTGAFGRLDLLVPILLAVIAVRFIRHPEKPEANGRIVIGLSALVIGVLGQVHIACGSPARSDGMQAIRDAGGLIGWGAATPLTYTMGEVLAVPLLVLLTVFGLLVVTATPVNAIPQRLRLLGQQAGHRPRTDDDDDEFGEDDERYDEQWREALPARPRRRGSAPEAYDPDGAEQEALTRRRAAQALRGAAARPEPADGRRGRRRGRRRRARRGRAARHAALAGRRRPHPGRERGRPRGDHSRPGRAQPGARAGAPGRQAAQGRQAGRPGAGPDQGRPRTRRASCRRAPSSSSSPATSPTPCPRSTSWSGAAPARRAAPPTTPSSPRSRTSSPSSRSTPPSPASPAGRRSRATRSSSAPR